MATPANRIILILLFMYLSYPSSGQKKTPSAAWLLPGISWRPAKDVRLQGQFGYNDYFNMGIFYPQAFITIHKNIVLNPAYIYAVQKSDGKPSVHEFYLMNAVILQANKNNFLFDDRNMLWNRITDGERPRYYYRNRLRVIRSFKTWAATTRLYGYDEIFYLFNEYTVSRNRAALGVNSDLTAHVNVDVTYIRQWDRYSGALHLFFIAAIWQL